MTLFEWLKASCGIPVQGLANLADKGNPKENAALFDSDDIALYDFDDAQLVVRG